MFQAPQEVTNTHHVLDRILKYQCETCKNYKKANKNYGCPIALNLVIRQTPTALANMDIYVKKGWCVHHERKNKRTN
jgi:hypothetical protein